MMTMMMMVVVVVMMMMVLMMMVVPHERGEAREEDVADYTKSPHI